MPPQSLQLPIKQVRQATSIEDWHQTIRQIAELETPVRTVIIYPNEGWLETEADYIKTTFEGSLLCTLKAEQTPNYQRSLLYQFKVGQQQFLLTTAKQWLKPEVTKTLQSELSPFILVVFEAELALGSKTKKQEQKDYENLSSMEWLRAPHIFKILRTQTQIKDEEVLKKRFGLLEEKLLFTEASQEGKALEVHQNVAFKVKRCITRFQKTGVIKKIFQSKVEHTLEDSFKTQCVLYVDDPQADLALLEQKLKSLIEQAKDQFRLITPQTLPEYLTEFKMTRDEIIFIFWQLPNSLQDLLQPQWWAPNSRKINVKVLYTKEDFATRAQKTKYRYADNPAVLKLMLNNLALVRQFCNAFSRCRVQTLFQIQGQVEIDKQACGQCDICLNDKPWWNPLQYLLY